MYQPKIGYTTVTWAVAGGSDWLEQGMRDISDLGFRAFETFSHTAMEYDDPPGRFRSLLDELKLHVACLDKIRALYQDPTQTEDIIADHQKATRFLIDHGGEILMTVPIGVAETEPRWTLTDFKVAASTLNEIGKRTLDMGATMAMHPHWGTYVQSPQEIDQIMELTDPRYVFFAPDSGQIAKGDGDPVDTARKYADRIAHVHLKDVATNWPELRNMGAALAMPAGYAPLGLGTVDLKGFIGVLADVNYEGWILGELDQADDPKGSAEIGRQYLIDELGFSLDMNRGQ